MKTLREIRAGRLGYAVLYSQGSIVDAPRVRAEKSKATTEARRRINLRKSWERLELLLYSNFHRDDFFVTLTYDDAHLPETRGAAVAKIKKYLGELRAIRKKRQQPLTYVYVTENKHGEGRLHHHLVLNGTGRDLDELHSLWVYGGIHIQNLRPREFSCLARYLTKEARDYEKRPGAKTWSGSQNLQKPEQPNVVSVSDLMTLSVPPGADLLESSGGDVHIGEFGAYSYVKYIYRSSEDARTPREPSDVPEEDFYAWSIDRMQPRKSRASSMR